MEEAAPPASTSPPPSSSTNTTVTTAGTKSSTAVASSASLAATAPLIPPPNANRSSLHEEGSQGNNSALSASISSFAPPPPSSGAGGWQPVLDETSGSVYYWNVNTGERSWDAPPGLKPLNNSNNNYNNYGVVKSDEDLSSSDAAEFSGTTSTISTTTTSLRVTVGHDEEGEEGGREREHGNFDSTDPQAILTKEGSHKNRGDEKHDGAVAVTEEEEDIDAQNAYVGADGFEYAAPEFSDSDSESEEDDEREGYGGNMASFSATAEDEMDTATRMAAELAAKEQAAAHRQAIESKFRAMLIEHGVTSLSRWETTLVHLLGDPRLKLLPMDEREDFFDDFRTNYADAALKRRREEAASAFAKLRDLMSKGGAINSLLTRRVKEFRDMREEARTRLEAHKAQKAKKRRERKKMKEKKDGGKEMGGGDEEGGREEERDAPKLTKEDRKCLKRFLSLSSHATLVDGQKLLAEFLHPVLLVKKEEAKRRLLTVALTAVKEGRLGPPPRKLKWSSFRDLLVRHTSETETDIREWASAMGAANLKVVLGAVAGKWKERGRGEERGRWRRMDGPVESRYDERERERDRDYRDQGGRERVRDHHHGRRGRDRDRSRRHKANEKEAERGRHHNRERERRRWRDGGDEALNIERERRPSRSRDDGRREGDYGQGRKKRRRREEQRGR